MAHAVADGRRTDHAAPSARRIDHGARHTAAARAAVGRTARGAADQTGCRRIAGRGRHIRVGPATLPEPARVEWLDAGRRRSGRAEPGRSGDPVPSMPVRPMLVRRRPAPMLAQSVRLGLPGRTTRRARRRRAGHRCVVPVHRRPMILIGSAAPARPGHRRPMIRRRRHRRRSGCPDDRKPDRVALVVRGSRVAHSRSDQVASGPQRVPRPVASRLVASRLARPGRTRPRRPLRRQRTASENPVHIAGAKILRQARHTGRLADCRPARRVGPGRGTRTSHVPPVVTCRPR